MYVKQQSFRVMPFGNLTRGLNGENSNSTEAVRPPLQSTQLAQSHHGLVDRIRPRMAAANADVILKPAGCREDQAGNDTDTIGERRTVEFQRIDGLGQFHPQDVPSRGPRDLCTFWKIFGYALTEDLNLVG